MLVGGKVGDIGAVPDLVELETVGHCRQFLGHVVVQPALEGHVLSRQNTVEFVEVRCLLCLHGGQRHLRRRQPRIFGACCRLRHEVLAAFCSSVLANFVAPPFY